MALSFHPHADLGSAETKQEPKGRDATESKSPAQTKGEHGGTENVNLTTEPPPPPVGRFPHFNHVFLLANLLSTSMMVTRYRHSSVGTTPPHNLPQKN